MKVLSGIIGLIVPLLTKASPATAGSIEGELIWKIPDTPG
jgi:hypothetical protein